MYNLKTPAIQKLVSKLVTECDEYFKSKIDSKEEDYKKFIEDYNDVIKNTETFRPNTQTEVNVTETTLKKLRSEGWDNADDPVLMKYEKDNSGVFNLKGGKTKLYDSGISFKGRTFKGQTSKENASVGLYERLKRSNIVFSDTEENGVVFYKDAGKGFEQDFSNGITMTYEEWLAANNLGQGTTAGDDFTEDYQAYLRRDRKATFETVPVQYTEAKWIMFKDNDDNKENNNKILVSDDKLWPNDFFPDKPNVNTYGELYKWLFNTEYGSIYYDEKSVEYWSNPNWAIGSEGPLKNENEKKESLSTQADITAFGFVSPSVIGVLTGTDITLTVPNGTDVSSLIVNFSSSNGSTVKVGTTVQVSGTTVNNFSSPVAYTVIAEDGVNLSTYNVKVTVVTNPQSTQADITAFSFTSPSVTGIINGTDITLVVPIATDISSLIATFTNSNNSVVKVGTTIQVSGTTPNDFNSPVAYTVLAGNGIDISTYNVKVTRSFLSNIPGTTGTNTTNTATQTTNNNLFNPKYYAKGPTASESTTQGEKFDLVTGLSYKCLRKTPIDYIPTKVSDNIKSNMFQNDVFGKLSTNRVSLMTYKKFDFGKKTITPDVFAKRAVDLYLEKFDNSLILNEWNAKIANDFWSNGLKNKIDGKSDIGIKHFIAREYPYNLGYYGDDSFFEIDNPWEDTTTLYDLLIEVIKEKNPELVKKPDVPLAPKFKPTIMIGETEVFVLDGVTKKDLSNFSIYVGDPKKWPVRENAEKEAEKGNIDDFEDVLDEEYQEDDFAGEEEVEIKIATEMVKEALSGDSGQTEPGAPAEIKPVDSLDSLLDLAAKCARELGKDPQITAAQLKGSTSAHLCPQGTLSVVYAMTGIKALGSISGDGDSFSFKSPPSRQRSSMVTSPAYYNDKIKLGNTKEEVAKYWNDESKWQIGDIIAVGYSGQKWGHIQVWTGVKWQSDFGQRGLGYHPDWPTVALWRLNDAGVEAVKKQFQIKNFT